MRVRTPPQLHRSQLVKVGDLVRVEGGTLRPEWYGKIGIVTSLEVPLVYAIALDPYYEVTLSGYGVKMIRDDMLVKLNEAR